MDERDARGWIGEALAVLAAGVALALLGPFGTGADLTAAERYGYWVGLTFLMWLQLVGALAALRRLERVRTWPVWIQAVLASLAGAVPTTFEVAWVEGLLRVGGVLRPSSLLETYVSVAVVAVMLFLPMRLLAARRRPAPETAAGTGLSRRLPPHLGERVIALRAEDHYLRVHTDRGEALVHYRFSDAVRELGPAGLQVHRSWWVAKDAVERAERDGDRHVLVLAGGLRAPVSRTYGLAAREAGLIPLRD